MFASCVIVRHRVALAAALTAAAVLMGTASASALPTSGTGPAVAEAPVIGGAPLAARGVVTSLPDGVPAPPALPAAAYVLADLDSGEILVAKNAHGRYLPASTLKVLTALTVLPLVDLTATVRAEPGDLVDGTQVGLDPGSRYTLTQLAQGMLMASGNDTATALARAAGGVPQTVQRMQAEARHLGAYDTVVHNPSGLDAPGQVTSCYDLALIARAAMALPEFRALVATKRARFPGKQVAGAKRTTYQIQNHNSLLWNYSGAIGVKNGYTIAARWTTVGAASRDGHTYLLTALRRSDRSWRPDAALLDWAFAHGGQAQAVGRLVQPGEIGTVGTDGTDGKQTPAAAPPALAAAAAAANTATVGGLDQSTRTIVGALGVAAALLAVLLFALSGRARRRQLSAVRAARSGRRLPR